MVQKKYLLVFFFVAGIFNIVFPYCGAFFIFSIFADNPPTITEYYSYFLGENLSTVSVYITAMILPMALMVVYAKIGLK